mmetsp:Transcript_5309/g.11629  ORF Transcript_5309/g.11629 Transcript_5309/m.11629 type:complete len:269 (-) Transcript_5309:1784-2590(-)
MCNASPTSGSSHPYSSRLTSRTVSKQTIESGNISRSTRNFPVLNMAEAKDSISKFFCRLPSSSSGAEVVSDTTDSESSSSSSSWNIRCSSYDVIRLTMQWMVSSSMSGVLRSLSRRFSFSSMAVSNSSDFSLRTCVKRSRDARRVATSAESSSIRWVWASFSRFWPFFGVGVAKPFGVSSMLSVRSLTGVITSAPSDMDKLVNISRILSPRANPIALDGVDTENVALDLRGVGLSSSSSSSKCSEARLSLSRSSTASSSSSILSFRSS